MGEFDDSGFDDGSAIRVDRDVAQIRREVGGRKLLAIEPGWVRALSVDAFDRGVVDPDGLQVYAVDVEDYLSQSLRRKTRSLAELAGRKAAGAGYTVIDDVTFVNAEGRFDLRGTGRLRAIEPLQAVLSLDGRAGSTLLRGEYELSIDDADLVTMLKSPLAPGGKPGNRVPLENATTAIEKFQQRHDHCLARLRFHVQKTPGLSIEWIGVTGRTRLVGKGTGAVFRISIEVPVAASLPAGTIELDSVFVSFLKPNQGTNIKEWLRLFDPTQSLTSDLQSARDEWRNAEDSYWHQVPCAGDTATGLGAVGYVDPLRLDPPLSEYSELLYLSRLLPFEDGIRIAVADRVARLVQDVLLSSDCNIRDVKEGLPLGANIRHDDPDRCDSVETPKVVTALANGLLFRLIQKLREPTIRLPDEKGRFFGLFKSFVENETRDLRKKAKAKRRGGSGTDRDA